MRDFRSVLQASADGVLRLQVRLCPFPVAEDNRNRSLVGPMCCTPERAGLEVVFSDWTLTPHPARIGTTLPHDIRAREFESALVSVPDGMTSLFPWHVPGEGAIVLARYGEGSPRAGPKVRHALPR